ncbi:MAG: CDP-glycerol glycerophosphotransferase family protein, partial [Clostridia bacterium]|nr:CDP-glycerol glycerophosphotransferase family protein [Clostridia bacterium]
ILLFRTHPYTSKLIGVNFDDFVRDYINYPDVNDLLKVSDILISDYSAVIFDYSILEKPIISFAYDYEEYGKERGFSIDIKKEMPGGICETENQVIDRIKNMDFNEEVKMVKVFKNKYCKYGGSAIVDCVKTLFDFYKDDII